MPMSCAWSVEDVSVPELVLATFPESFATTDLDLGPEYISDATLLDFQTEQISWADYKATAMASDFDIFALREGYIASYDLCLLRALIVAQSNLGDNSRVLSDTAIPARCVTYASSLYMGKAGGFSIGDTLSATVLCSIDNQLTPNALLEMNLKPE